MAVPYNRLGTFKASEGQISRTYGPWALIVGWLGAIFRKLIVPLPDRLDSRRCSIRAWPRIRRPMPWILPSYCWYLERVNRMPYNLVLDPSDQEIVDDTHASLADFSYLVSYRTSVFIYHSGLKIYAEVYCLLNLGDNSAITNTFPGWLVPVVQPKCR